MKRLTCRQLSMTAATLLAIGGATGLPRPLEAAPPVSNNGSCPNISQLETFKVANNVAATFTTNDNTATYWFFSLTDEKPKAGVPGLIKYCVYPDPAATPSTITVTATGANNRTWISGADSSDFMFARPSGDKSNIPLDGTSKEMGTATWSDAPAGQILLHINDPAECAGIYGAGGSSTCFVKPSSVLPCDAGDSTVAYNAMPFGVVNCRPPSEAFEAQSASEFGDEVGLAETARTLVSLNVAFSSYACEVGHWNGGNCSTTSGATFTHPITAFIYEAADCSGTPCKGALLAQSGPTPFEIPYRPSSNPLCPDPSQWFNPLANAGAGACQYSIQKVLKFTFTGITLPTSVTNVIWTVAFNTTNHGAIPIGEGAACFSDPAGCPYDSLNVATKSFAGAPYAGTDVDPNGAFLSSTWTGAYCDGGTGGTGFLRLDTGNPCWSPYRPLGEIITKP